PTYVPVRLDKPALRDQAHTGTLPPILTNLTNASLTTKPTARPSGERSVPLSQRLRGLSESEQRVELLELVRSNTATVLGHTSPGSLQTDRGFQDLGLDSLTAVELRNRLTASTGLRLPATLIFDHPTVNEVAQYLHAELCAPESDPVDPVLAELDRIEKDFNSLSDDLRTNLSSRLQSLMAKLAEHSTPDSHDVAQQIESASDNEIFRFIDQELGITRSEED
ncbi:phosphopantetheine-binding protein, partial [Streptomyces sp. NPDC046976]|uniref:phosphopantetheine-binding protein n=1 Tax=Streptomyces sp. NPDC046976 TaxID=3155258 RepID=UPI0033EF8B14